MLEKREIFDEFLDTELNNNPYYYRATSRKKERNAKLSSRKQEASKRASEQALLQHDATSNKPKLLLALGFFVC